MSEAENVPVKIDDFESFLQKCLNCKELKLINHSALTMLPLGENFCSLIVKIDATVRKNQNAKEETLHYVAKTPASSNKAVVEWSFTFLPEVFVYTEVIPMYREVEKELKVEMLDFYPEFIGHRYSLEDGTDVIDEHSMLLMENLTARDYYVADKAVGLDVEHARKVTCCLAKFHALGMALIKLRPIIIEKMIKNAMSRPFDFKEMDDTFDNTLKFIRANDSFTKHIKVIEGAFAEVKNGNLWIRSDNGSWATMIHGDFWINNIMFHKNANGHVDDVKFIDYQAFQCSSLFRDVSRLICACLSEDTMSNSVDEIIDLYYKTFIESVERVGHDSKPLTREEFDKELKRQSVIQFPLCAAGLNIIASKTSQDKDFMVQGLKKLINIYEKRGWF